MNIWNWKQALWQKKGPNQTYRKCFGHASITNVVMFLKLMIILANLIPAVYILNAVGKQQDERHEYLASKAKCQQKRMPWIIKNYAAFFFSFVMSVGKRYISFVENIITKPSCMHRLYTMHVCILYYVRNRILQSLKQTSLVIHEKVFVTASIQQRVSPNKKNNWSISSTQAKFVCLKIRGKWYCILSSV